MIWVLLLLLATTGVSLASLRHAWRKIDELEAAAAARWVDLVKVEDELIDALAAVRRWTKREGLTRGVAERAARRIRALEARVWDLASDHAEMSERSLPAAPRPLSDQSIPAKPWGGDAIVLDLPAPVPYPGVHR